MLDARNCAMASHAASVPNTLERVRLYNDILDVFRELRKSVPRTGLTKALRAHVIRNYPILNTKILASGQKSSYGINGLFRFLFPTPRCPQCATPLVAAHWQKLFCSKTCFCQYHYGYDNIAQLPDVKQKRADTNLKKYGFASCSQSEEIKAKVRATNISRRGVPYPMQSLEVQAKSRASMKSRLGVEYALQSEACLVNFKRTMTARHGVAHALQSGVLADKAAQTSLARFGYSNASNSPEVQEKIKRVNQERYGGNSAMCNNRIQCKAQATTQSNYGVAHPLQNKELFAKAMRTAHRVKTVKYGKRVVEYQGWEDTVFALLAKKFGLDSVLTQFDSDFPDWIFAEAGTFPDLFVSTKNLFVEVKSLWTFLGRKTNLRVNRKKASNLRESGNKCRWVVVLKPHHSYVILPDDWDLMSRSALTSFLKTMVRYI